MDVHAEAKRIMAVSLGKLYNWRSQRGGVRLHRSLMLTLVMRSARDIYHSSCLITDIQPATVQSGEEQTEEPMDTDLAKSGPSAPESELPASPNESLPYETECKGRQSSCKQDDKENRGPAKQDRKSRKRRGKAADEPDFLPSKRARLDTGEDRKTAQNMAFKNSTVNCRPVVDTRTSLPLSQIIEAF